MQERLPDARQGAKHSRKQRSGAMSKLCVSARGCSVDVLWRATPEHGWETMFGRRRERGNERARHAEALTENIGERSWGAHFPVNRAQVWFKTSRSGRPAGAAAWPERPPCRKRPPGRRCRPAGAAVQKPALRPRARQPIVFRKRFASENMSTLAKM